MKIAVVGVGYVGLSNAVLLSQHHQVTAIDINEEIVASLNRQESHIKDPDIERYLKEKELHLTATIQGIKLLLKRIM